MTDQYSTILARCLARQDKAHRDAVLAEYPPHTQAIMRRMMQGIAKRLAAYIVNAGAREWNINAGDRRRLRRERLAAIKEPWLRERVEVIVKEMFAERRRAQFEKAREAVE